MPSQFKITFVIIEKAKSVGNTFVINKFAPSRELTMQIFGFINKENKITEQHKVTKILYNLLLLLFLNNTNIKIKIKANNTNNV